MTRHRLLWGTALTLLASLAGAAPALAGQVNHPPGSSQITFLAAGGEANDLTVTATGTEYRFADAGAPVTPVSGSDCTQVDPNTVACPAPGVTFIQIDLGDLGDRVALGGTPATLVFGRAGDDNLSGGDGGDELVGGAGRDTLAGNGGDDELADRDLVGDPGASEPSTMDGGTGNDLVTGGEGPDDLTGGPGADTVSGNGGEDTVRGGDDGDLLSGGDGADTLLGEAGDDRLGTDERIGAASLPSEQGSDTLDGGPGDDELRPGLGGAGDGDRLAGGTGSDLVTYSRRSDTLDVSLDGGANDGGEGEGDDVAGDVERVLGGSAGDVLTGGPGADVIDGGPGSDVIDGGPGTDTLDGGSGDAGNDELRGGDDADTLSGNAGNDRIDGGSGGDVIAGGNETDTIGGGPGDDAIEGGAGADVLDGGAGSDTVDGAALALFVPDGSDTLSGGDGRDTLSGGAGPDQLAGGGGVDDMRGGDGLDTVDYGVAAVDVTVTLDGRANDGGRGESDNVAVDVENVDGGGLEDTLTGSREANVLDAGSGQDYVDGAAGRDDLRGGRGIDVIRARDNGSADVVDCGTGGGADFAILDPADRARRCERVDAGRRARPVRGRQVVIRPARGANGFGPPGMRRTVPLLDRLAVPVASSVDARRGRVALTAASGRRGRAQATFFAGAFKVAQRRGRSSYTELRLTGGDFGVCRAGASQAGARMSGRKKRKVRRLWGSGHGRFRTSGRWSSAAARGTVWLVEDRCDGTLTRVRRGTVVVRDFVRRRTVIVRAGDSYLARRPR
jgi:Ca2+-binding RTX toxin-like protein